MLQEFYKLESLLIHLSNIYLKPFNFKTRQVKMNLFYQREKFISYPMVLNGSLLIYSGTCKCASPDAFGGVDTNCNATSLSNSMRSTLRSCVVLISIVHFIRV